MATISRRGDSQWQAKVRMKGCPPQSKTFTFRDDAEKWGKETEVAIERGLFFDRTKAEQTTLNELITKYRSEELPKKKGRHYAPSLNVLEREFGSYALAIISSEMIAKFRDKRLATVAASTVRKEINLLSSIVDLSTKEWGTPVAFNPCKLVSLPKEPRGRDRRLINDEYDRLLKECGASSIQMKAIFIVAVETASRLGELLKMQWAHINFADSVAFLPDTKNGENRSIALSPVAISALRSVPRNINGRVFNNWSASDSFNKTWQRICKRAGVEDLRFHDLRHEGVSRLFEKGLSIMEVASISGHKSLTSLKNYTHMIAKTIAQKLAA